MPKLKHIARGLLCLALLPQPLPAAPTPPLLLAETAPASFEVGAYLVSEKLDGVRAYWDGRRLLSRRGNELAAPDWFLAALPPVPLDGELWLGRGQFERLSGIVRRQKPVDAEWREVRYMLFELPGAPGTFRERSARLGELVRAANVPWLVEISQNLTVDREILQKSLEAVVAAGGEGLMLHRADAPYVSGRDPALLKLKPRHDAEATVIGHLPGKGKYRGQLGALRVRTADGREFALGSGLSDAQRREPPPIGALVSYRYRDLTARGLPRFATFLRQRDDF